MKHCIIITLIILGLSARLYSQREDISYSYQRLITYNKAENNDYVGKFYSCFTYESKYSITYSKISGSDAYKIEPVTGMVYISDNSKLRSGVDTMGIRVCDGDYCGNYYVIITVKDVNNCVFVDPGYPGTGEGTREKPYSDWSDIRGKLQAGKTYLQKRGSVSYSSIHVTGGEKGIEGNPIVLGAYGKGVRPKVDGKNINNANGIYVGDWSNPTAYVEIYSFIVYNCRGVMTTPGTNHVKFFNCEAYKNSDNGNFYIYHDSDPSKPLYHELYNIIAHQGLDHGMKIQASGCIAINCHTYDNDKAGFKFSLQSDGNSCKYILSNNNGKNGLSLDGDYMTISNCISYSNNYNGYQFSMNGHDNIFKDSYSYDNNKNGINIKQYPSNLTIENVKSYNNNYNGVNIYGDANTITIIRCEFYQNKQTGIWIEYDSYTPNIVKNIKINHNIIHNNIYQGIMLEDCEEISIINNTLDNNSIKIATSAKAINTINNITESIDGSSTGSNNILKPADSFFINPAGRNYNPTEYAKETIKDKGLPLGFTSDYYKNPIVGLPDIGAIEYLDSLLIVPEDSTNINNPPTIEYQQFTIDHTLASGTLIGRVIASDPDQGQSISYSIIDGNDNNWFEINPGNGDLSIKNPTDVSSTVANNLTIKVSDDGPDSLSVNGTVTVIVQYSETVVDNNPPVINNQEFNIREEHVLSMLTLRVIASDSDVDQNLTFSIISGNYDNIFELNSISGTLTINDTSKLNFQDSIKIYLDIKVQDDGEGLLSSSATITFNIIPKITTFYIDPSNTYDPYEDGSVEHPYDSWKDVSWKEGSKYFQKKGTTVSEKKINIYASNVTLGAYGDGERPIINSQASDFAIRVFEKTDITIENIKIIADDAISCIYFLGSSCDNNIVENCYLEGADNGVRIIDGKTITLRYNTFSNNSDAVYSYAETTKIYYNIFKENDVGINISSYLSSTEIYNNVFYDNTKGVSTSYSALIIYNNIFYLLDKGDQAINHKLDNLVSDNNIYYPEQDGFLDIDNTKYSSLYDYQETTGLDINSFTSDPLFKDVYNDVFSVELESPAIDGGRDVGLLMDYYGYSVPAGRQPDIGLTELLDDDAAIVSSIEPFFGDGEAGEAPLIFPNPSEGIFNITFSNTNFQTSELQIQSIAGSLIYQEYINSEDVDQPAQIDITHAPKGIYVVLVAIDDKIYTQRVIVN